MTNCILSPKKKALYLHWFRANRAWRYHNSCSPDPPSPCMLRVSFGLEAWKDCHLPLCMLKFTVPFYFSSCHTTQKLRRCLFHQAPIKYKLRKRTIFFYLWSPNTYRNSPRQALAFFEWICYLKSTYTKMKIPKLFLSKIIKCYNIKKKFGGGRGTSCYPHNTQVTSVIKGENFPVIRCLAQNTVDILCFSK